MVNRNISIILEFNFLFIITFMELLDLNIRWLGNILECQYNFSYVVIAKVPIGIRAKYPLAFGQSTFWHLGSFF